METYEVVAIIKGKPLAKDPEGETIKRYLIDRKSHDVEEIRTAKMLIFKIRASSKEKAVREIEKLCNDLRVYNPLAHELEVYSK